MSQKTNRKVVPLAVGISAALPILVLALSPVLAGQNPASPGGQDAAKSAGGPPPGDPLGPDLFIAIYENDLPGVKSALDKGAKTEATNWLGVVPIHWAALKGNAPACAALLDKGANINAESPYGGVLEFAVLGGDTATVKLLLDKGVKFSKSRNDGQTAVMAAAAAGHNDILRLLLAKRPDVNIPDAVGMTALSHASRRGQIEAARLLLDSGATIDATDKAGRTPLMYAALNGHPQIVKLLLDKGAKVNVKDKNGDTPAILAARYSGDAEVARLLVKPTNGKMTAAMPDAKGRTPATIALGHGYTSYAAVLDAKAKPISVNDPTARAAQVRKAVLRSLPLIESTTRNFSEKSGGCVSCHHQGLGLMTTGTMKTLGYKIDAELAANEQKVVMSPPPGVTDMLGMLRGLVGHPEQYKHFPTVDMNEASPGFSTPFAALVAHKVPRNEPLEMLTTILMRQQMKDGGWGYGFDRAPLQSSRFAYTAYSIQVMKAYLPDTLARERDERIAKAMAWLNATPAVSNEDQTYKLLALKWAGAPTESIVNAKADLLKTQRSDGGWAQFNAANPAGDAYRRSDAYATGEALYALHVGGGVPGNDPAYRRGVDYLLRTQDDDGSWYVNKRAVQANNYFDTGFPHGESQYISYSATCWATMALAFAAEPSGAKTTASTTRQ
jgi:ankyrin repeat protein